MAIVKETIKESLKALFTELSSEEDKEASIEKYSDRLSDIIINAIKSADVTVKPGIALQAGPYTGSTIAPGSGSLQ